MRPIDIRKLVVRDAKVSDLRLSLDKDGNTILTRQPDNSAIGTAASKDTGTDPDEIPLNSDLGSASINDIGTSFDQIPLNTDIVYPIANVAALRALTGISVGQRFQLDEHTSGGVGSGPLRCTSNYTDETDDDGVTFVIDGVVVERVLDGFVTPAMFGIIESGDESVSLGRFFSYCDRTKTTGVFDGEQIDASSLGQLVIVNGLRLRAKGKPTISGNFTANDYPFSLASGGIDFEYIKFAGFTDLVSAGDGRGGSMPYNLTGDIDLVRLNNCDFDDCRRPLFLFTDPDSHLLVKLDLQNNTINGKTGATQYGWSGLFAGWSNLESATIKRNRVKNLNATAAGFSGTTPANVGNGLAIQLGGTFVTDANYTQSGWSIRKNYIDSVIDSRNAGAGINPEVGGIRITGARGCEIVGNVIKNVQSNGTVTDDCEGIYTQVSESIIKNNRLKNTGKNGGAIVIKGRNRLGEGTTATQPDGFTGECSGNIIVNDGSFEASGIAIYTSGWNIHHNHVEGCGGDDSRFASFWSNAQDNSDTKLNYNTVKNDAGRFGFLITSYGNNIEILSNVIDGVLGTLAGAAPTTYGIYVLNVDGNGLNTTSIPLSNMNIKGNSIGRLEQTGASSAIALQSDGSITENITVAGNKITDTVSNGLRLLSGNFAVFDIYDNNLRNATTKLLSSADSVANLSAKDNKGWLEAEVSANPSSLASGANAVVVASTNIADLQSRDNVIVTTNTLRAGLQIWVDITSSVGDVDIYMLNNTGSTVDLSTTTFRLKAEKIDNNF